jgi:hypothetical protein
MTVVGTVAAPARLHQGRLGALADGGGHDRDDVEQRRLLLGGNGLTLRACIGNGLGDGGARLFRGEAHGRLEAGEALLLRLLPLLCADLLDRPVPLLGELQDHADAGDLLQAQDQGARGEPDEDLALVEILDVHRVGFLLVTILLLIVRREQRRSETTPGVLRAEAYQTPGDQRCFDPADTGCRPPDGDGRRTPAFTLMKTALPISRAGGAEAEVVVALARLVPVPVRGAQVPGVVVPGAAAVHAVGAAQGPVPSATVLPHLDERKAGVTR